MPTTMSFSPASTVRNLHEELRRERRARRFAFMAWGAGYSSRDAVGLPDAEWAKLAAASKLNPPSADCIAIAIEVMRDIETAETVRRVNALMEVR